MFCKKMDVVFRNGIEFFFCCGEILDVCEFGNYFLFIWCQLEESLFYFDVVFFGKVVIVYELVWVIGIGFIVIVEQVEEVYVVICLWISECYDDDFVL